MGYVMESVFGEEEFLHIDEYMPDLWHYFEMIMSINFAKILYSYMRRKSNNKDVADVIKKNLWDSIKPYVINQIMADCGVTETVRHENPYTIGYHSNLDEIIENIAKLKEEYGSLRLDLKSPSAEDFTVFVSVYCHYVASLPDTIPHTYTNVYDRLLANKSIFVPRNTQELPDVKLLIGKQQSWEMMYNGARYMKYCKEHNIEERLSVIF